MELKREAQHTDLRFEEILERDGTLVFTNVGISMLPLLRQGRDIMVLKRKAPDIRCKKYDVVLFKRDNGQYVVHRVLRVCPDGYWIVGDNCVSGESIGDNQVLAVLTAIKRSGKIISVTDRAYLIYVHLWCAPCRLRFLLLRTCRLARRCASRIKQFIIKHFVRR